MSSAAAFALRFVLVSTHIAVAVIGLIVALCASTAIPVWCGLTPAPSIAVQLLDWAGVQGKGERALVCHQFVKPKPGSLPVLPQGLHHWHQLTPTGLYGMGKVLSNRHVFVGVARFLAPFSIFSLTLLDRSLIMITLLFQLQHRL